MSGTRSGKVKEIKNVNFLINFKFISKCEICNRFYQSIVIEREEQIKSNIQNKFKLSQHDSHLTQELCSQKLYKSKNKQNVKCNVNI